MLQVMSSNSNFNFASNSAGRSLVRSPPRPTWSMGGDKALSSNFNFTSNSTGRSLVRSPPRPTRSMGGDRALNSNFNFASHGTGRPLVRSPPRSTRSMGGDRAFCTRREMIDRRSQSGDYLLMEMQKTQRRSSMHNSDSALDATILSPQHIPPRKPSSVSCLGEGLNGHCPSDSDGSVSSDDSLLPSKPPSKSTTTTRKRRGSKIRSHNQSRGKYSNRRKAPLPASTSYEANSPSKRPSKRPSKHFKSPITSPIVTETEIFTFLNSPIALASVQSAAPIGKLPFEGAARTSPKTIVSTSRRIRGNSSRRRSRSKEDNREEERSVTKSSSTTQRGSKKYNINNGLVGGDSVKPSSQSSVTKSTSRGSKEYKGGLDNGSVELSSQNSSSVKSSQHTSTSTSSQQHSTRPRAQVSGLSSDRGGGLTDFLTSAEQKANRRNGLRGARSVVSMPAYARATRNGRRRSSMGTIPTGTTSREGAPSPIKENKARPESSRTNTPIDQSWSGDESSDIDTGEDEHNPLSATFNSSWSEQEIHKSKQMELHINRTDNLLFKVFPKHIAEALREGRKVEPEEHDMVTIFFSDIVGFTDISATLDPMKICDLLDRLYHAFDALSIIHKVFKVETIGDAYMGVTNMEKSPSQHRDHVRRIAEFAIDAIKVANQTLIDKDDVTKGYVHIRVGFHSGPVVSNVVGTRNPRYCLFGDTVNTASRMESNSAVDRIHCSEESAVLLQEQCGSIQSFPRGAIMVKGKGEMNTFWVHQDGPPEPNTKSKVKKFGKMMKGKNIKKLFGKLKQ